ncbi:MAG TPA: hypothetical protein VF211_05850 [Burkholderiales bacterium]
MRSFRNRALCWALVSSLNAIAGAAGAQEVACESGAFYARLVKRYGETCMRDNPALQSRIEQATQGLYGGEAATKAWLEAIRDALRAQTAALPAPVAPGSDRYIAGLRKRLRDAIDFLADHREPGAALQACARLRTPTTSCPIDLDNFAPLEDSGDLIEENGCRDASEANAACRTVYETAVEIADSTLVARYTVDALHKPEREKFRAAMTRLGERWHAYLYDTGFQYWWELAGNRYLEEHCDNIFNWPMTRLLRKKCEHRTDTSGNPIGWRAVPEYHVVYLHPDVGAQYNTEEPHGDRLKPSLVFQWLGYEWWQWRGSKISKLRGVSFATTVSDNKVARTLGHGLQIRINEYAVSITSHGGKPALTLSLNLADKLSDLDEEWANRLKRISSQER